MVLLAVLVVVVILSLAAWQFGELMSAEHKAADSYKRTAQARAMANSGIYYAAAMLSNTDAFLNNLNSNPYDNPTVFQNILVQPNSIARFQGRFSIVAPLDVDTAVTSAQSFRYGAVDESGKVNLNALMKMDPAGTIAQRVLMALPNMTEEVAAAILDWIDTDDEIRANGCESEYYTSQSPPYRAKNGPLDSLEELLLVRGVTPQLLWGNDRNRNGIMEPDEDDGSGMFDMGWASYLTVYSRERNIDKNGNARIYVNDSDLSALYDKLSTALGEEMANFIIAYRIHGQTQQQSTTTTATVATTPAAPAASSGTTGARVTVVIATTQTSNASATRTGTLTRDILGDLTSQQGQSLSSLYALVNTDVTISTPSQQPGGQPTSTRYVSPLNDSAKLQELLPLVLDQLTTMQDAEIPARINVNTAQRAVLMTLPNITETQVQTIMEQRPALASSEEPDEIYETPAWLMTEANIDAATMRSWERYITARSQVYRVQSLGYFDGGGPTARIEAVIDTNGGRPRILFYRELTELGKGFNLQLNTNQ